MMAGIYGSAHRRLRAQARREVDAGGVVCWRCGKPIPPGADFDLGHAADMGDPSQYGGPECIPCNRATARHRAANVVDESRLW